MNLARNCPVHRERATRCGGKDKTARVKNALEMGRCDQRRNVSPQVRNAIMRVGKDGQGFGRRLVYTAEASALFPDREAKR